MQVWAAEADCVLAIAPKLRRAMVMIKALCIFISFFVHFCRVASIVAQTKLAHMNCD